MFPERIETENLVLKKDCLEDAGVVFNAIDSGRERLRKFLTWVDGVKEESDTKEYVKFTFEQREQEKAFSFNLFLKEGNVFIGKVGLPTVAMEHKRCELGYWLSKEYEGKGYISEAVRGLEETAFNFGFNRIEIRCSSANSRSANVPKRVGYHLEGVLRQEAIENGEYRDTLVFSKLRQEYDHGKLD